MTKAEKDSLYAARRKAFGELIAAAEKAGHDPIADTEIGFALIPLIARQRRTVAEAIEPPQSADKRAMALLGPDHPAVVAYRAAVKATNDAEGWQGEI